MCTYAYLFFISRNHQIDAYGHFPTSEQCSLSLRTGHKWRSSTSRLWLYWCSGFKGSFLTRFRSTLWKHEFNFDEVPSLIELMLTQFTSCLDSGLRSILQNAKYWVHYFRFRNIWYITDILSVAVVSRSFYFAWLQVYFLRGFQGTGALVRLITEVTLDIGPFLSVTPLLVFRVISEATRKYCAGWWGTVATRL